MLLEAELAFCPRPLEYHFFLILLFTYNPLRVTPHFHLAFLFCLFLALSVVLQTMLELGIQRLFKR